MKTAVVVALVVCALLACTSGVDAKTKSLIVTLQASDSSEFLNKDSESTEKKNVFYFSYTDLMKETGKAELSFEVKTQEERVNVKIKAVDNGFLRKRDWTWECESERVICVGSSGTHAKTYMSGLLEAEKGRKRDYKLELSFDRVVPKEVKPLSAEREVADSPADEM